MNYMKFIKFRPISFSIIFVWNMISLNGYDINIEKHKEILADLPKAEDLDNYVISLDRTLGYCLKHKNYMDSDLFLGLFILAGNINQVLREKEGKLPPNLSDRLKRMLQKFSVLEDYFHGMVQNFYMNNHKHIHKDPDDEINHLNDVNILHLLNLTIWQALEKFNVELLKRTKIYNRDELTTIYGDWETYAKTITNIRLLVPNIQESDTCIAQLAKIPIFPSRRSQPRCFVRQHCRVYLKNGNDYGYGLLHRLLFFIMAKYARNCAVFSEKEDKYIMDHLCSMSYNECQYIAQSDFALPDLLAESHALCGMLGHAQFLTNDWVKTIMMHQVTEGCLRDEGIKSHETVVDATEPGILSIANPVMGGICNRHFTAVGLATFSNVVRYIIETYF